MDIVDLREFYGSRLGLATRRSLAGQLKPRLAGRADMGRVSALVKARLGG